MPSVRPQLAEPLGGCPQVPTVFPVAMVQMPLQQPALAVQASPTCRQKDEALQSPLKQSPEQQSALDVHALLRVLQVVLSGVHVPPVHVPLQQAELALHAFPSEVHAGRLHTPPVQVAMQQSLACWQAPPTWRHPVPLELVVMPELVVIPELVLPPPPVAAPVPCVAPVWLLPQPVPSTAPAADAITAEKTSRR
jgi:hypothetical protein